MLSSNSSLKITREKGNFIHSHEFNTKFPFVFSFHLIRDAYVTTVILYRRNFAITGHVGYTDVGYPAGNAHAPWPPVFTFEYEYSSMLRLDRKCRDSNRRGKEWKCPSCSNGRGELCPTSNTCVPNKTYLYCFCQLLRLQYSRYTYNEITHSCNMYVYNIRYTVQRFRRSYTQLCSRLRDYIFQYRKCGIPVNSDVHCKRFISLVWPE